MTARLPCPPAPAPLEADAARFDELFASRAQRRGFRDCVGGLLRDGGRNKTLTCLAGTEPDVGAQHPEAQRLQWFLSESNWDEEKINDRRLEVLKEDPATRPHPGGVLIIDDSGDRKAGHATDCVSRQYIGSVGGIQNGIVAVTTTWADEAVYYPLHAEPYTPAPRLEGGRRDPAFRTKGQIAGELAGRACGAGFPFRAAVGDCFYGPSESPGFVAGLREAGTPFVLGLKPNQRLARPDGEDGPRTPAEAARERDWGGPGRPGQWTRVERVFRDGHAETWWAADCRAGSYRIYGPMRLVVATTDPAALPECSTWYLATDFARPDLPTPPDPPRPAAALAEVVYLYSLRPWCEQDYKQGKNELGWADFQVRSSRAIRRHWILVNCAFSFCWHHEQHADAPAWRDVPPPTPPAPEAGPGIPPETPPETRPPQPAGPPQAPAPEAGPGIPPETPPETRPPQPAGPPQAPAPEAGPGIPPETPPETRPPQPAGPPQAPAPEAGPGIPPETPPETRPPQPAGPPQAPAPEAGPDIPPETPPETSPAPASPPAPTTRQRPVLCWPVALRRVRSWLTPLHMLQCIIRACDFISLSPEVQNLLYTLKAGQGINLYLPP